MSLFLKQNKRKSLHKNRVQFPGLAGDTNMAAVPLFRDTNTAAVASRENILLLQNKQEPTQL